MRGLRKLTAKGEFQLLASGEIQPVFYGRSYGKSECSSRMLISRASGSHPMSSLLAYKGSIAILLGLLAASSGMGAYLYQLRSNDLNTQISRTSDLSNQISNLNTQIDLLKAEIQNLTSTTANQLNGLKAQVASLQAQVTQLQNQISQLQATDQQQTSQIQQFQTQISQLQALVQQLQTEIQQLQQIVLNGAGATLPFPFIAAATSAYTMSHTNVTINYSPIGSGAGINALIQKTIDFAASDQPLTANDLSKLTSPPVQIPETIGGVVIAYNLAPTIKTSGLNLTATVAAKIFSGAITSWNDPAIQSLNTVTLPNLPIRVAHRSDGSGTTYVFTSWLYTSGTWTGGVGKTANWAPGSYGAYGNQGVAGFIQGTNNTIGYVELNYALSATPKMTYSYIQNSANNFIAPSLQTLGYAVSNYTSTFPTGDGNWTSVSLLNQPGAQTYPIASFTYVMVYKDLSVLADMTLQKAKALVNFLWYLVHQAQTLAGTLDYPPLPASVVAVDETTLHSINFNGQTLLV